MASENKSTPKAFTFQPTDKPSSFIKLIAWAEDVLFVQFEKYPDVIYTYSNVWLDRFYELQASKSPGKFLNGVIKPNHNCIKMNQDNANKILKGYALKSTTFSSLSEAFTATTGESLAGVFGRF